MTDAPTPNADAAAAAAAAAPGAAPAGLDGQPAAKRGRGRPRKPVGLSPAPAAGGAGAAPAAGNQPAENLAIPLWNAGNCGPIGKLPFLAAGIATGYDGWALEDKEAAAIAEPLAQVLNAFVPAGGKYAAVAALGSTLFVVGAMKYKGYREYKAAEAAKAKKDADNAGAGK